MKKILIFLIVLSLFLNVCGFSLEDESCKNVSIDEARLVAFNHIVSVINMDTDSIWKEGVKFSLENVLYDFDDRPSAYYFTLTNFEGKKVGYVIVGADRDYVPIIEYSYCEEPVFLKDKLSGNGINGSLHKENRYYYFKGLSYFCKYSDGKKVF